MDSYLIKNTTEGGYDRFLLLLSFESILNHVSSIELLPNMRRSSGRILIDQLFVTGNGDNRFISCEFYNGKLDFNTAKIVRPANFFRQETVDWLHDNYSYVENSIITESQRQKVKNRIVF